MRSRSCFVGVVLLAAGCAPKLIRPASISLCRQGSCETVSDAASRGRFLAALHDLLREVKGREMALFSANPGTRAEKKPGLSFFVQGGPIPGRSTVSALRVDELFFVDRERSEIKIRGKTMVTYLGLPVICAQSGATFTVSPDQAGMTLSNLCTWGGLGTTVSKFQWLIDRVDFDAGVASGQWSVRTAGLPVLGGGGGYMVARFREAPRPEEPPRAPPLLSAPSAPPEPPSPAKAAPAAVEPPPSQSIEFISGEVQLRLGTRLRDENGNLQLEGGEEVVLRVTAENVGKSPAGEVQVILSGDETLVDCLGRHRGLGTISPGASAIAEFRCRLPAQVPSKTASLRLELLAGPKGVVAGTKVLKVGMRSAAAPVVEEVVSELSVDDIPSRPRNAGPSQNVALVIGLGRYREKAIPPVKYAARDAEVMARYLENVGGVAPANLKLLTDDAATKSDLEAYFEDWLPRHAVADSSVFIYYSGHGTPDITGKEAFIVPYEGHPDFPTKLYPLKRMYDALAKLPAKAVIVMLDSCFSGAKGRGLIQEGARPLLLTMDRSFAPGGRVSVLAGATGSQIASDFDQAEHGLFTYYLLKGLRGEADSDHDGIVSLGEIFSFVRENVSRKASAELNRDQTPVLLGAAAADSKIPVTRHRP